MLPDLRYALRMIRQQPWFSAAIIGTLALGIGVNTTVFTLVNAVLFKPLPLPGGERIVMVPATLPAQSRDFISVSYPDLRDFRTAASSFDQLEGFSGRSVNVSEQGNPPDRYRGAMITSGLFSMLKTPPVLGRALSATDERAGAEAVMLISHGVWKDRYGMDPKVIGRAVRANEKPAVIVGVMPEGFRFPNNEEVWLNLDLANEEWEKRENQSLMMIGMLKPGRTRPEAQAELAVVADRLARQYPDTHKGRGISVRTFHEMMNGGSIRVMFLLLMGAVGFVLLIACANVANMLLGRALSRRREISLRVTLGASRMRIVRQLLVESVTLSFLGGAIGLMLAGFGVRAFALAVEDVGKPYWIHFDMDFVVFAYFAVVCMLAGILFGLAPAIQATRINLNEALKEGSKSSGSARSGYLSAGLVVVQFTLAVILLSAAGLMIRSFLSAQSEFASIQPERILRAYINLPKARYPTPESHRQFFDRLVPALASMPGAVDVSLTSYPPGEGFSTERFEISGQAIQDPDKRPIASAIVTAPGYLSLIGFNIGQGRDFTATDGLAGKEAVLVSRAFMTKYFPRESPLGKQIRFFNEKKAPKSWMTIVGILPDLPQAGPGNQMQGPLVAVPYNWEASGGMLVAVKTAGSAAILTPAMRRQVQRIDGELPLDVRTLQASLDRGRWPLRVFGTLFLIFALIALGLAAVGIYAVIAYATTQRTREIGVRLALGAEAGTIVRMVLNRGLAQIAVGLTLGLAAAFYVCRLMGSFLFKVSPSDPLTFGIVGLALFAAGLAACLIPAYRASRLDPVTALRHE